MEHIEYTTKSKRGCKPYSSRRIKQDDSIVEIDGVTGAALVAVFDGHGKCV